jgi:predicted amidophosphoribosyltransferase
LPEPKTSRHWIDRGYQFVDLGNCDACGAPVEFWSKNNQLLPLDGKTLETHYSSCMNAKQFRTEQKLRAGVL